MLFLLSLAFGRVTELKARKFSEPVYWQKWQDFQEMHGEGMGRYSSIQDHDSKYLVFKANVDKIEEHNEGDHSYKLGVTIFADWTREEFSTYVNKGLIKKKEASERNFVKLDTSSIPSAVDWRTQGAVTPVKNQGSCGSCWAFSTTGSMEGAYAIKNGDLKSFSEQQLVSCSTENNGCGGGSMDLAFMYTEDHPLETEDDYPYTSGGGSVAACKYDSNEGVAAAVSYHDVTEDSSDDLKAAIAQQPVSVAIEADQDAFQFYISGIITSSACGTNLDHGVLAVGYGTDGGQQYYTVKNSWSSSWGESGYVRIAIENGEGICGIQEMASYPKL